MQLRVSPAGVGKSNRIGNANKNREWPPATGTADGQVPIPSMSILTMSARQLIQKVLQDECTKYAESHELRAQNPTFFFHSQYTLPAGRNTVQTARITYECIYIAVVVTKKRYSLSRGTRVPATSLTTAIDRRHGRLGWGS